MFGIKFRNLNINTRLILLLIFLSVITINYYFVIRYFDAQLNEIEKVTNLAGRNRSYAQKIAFYAVMVKQAELNNSSNEQEYRSLLRDAIDKHDYNLQKLRLGGIVKGKQILGIPPEMIATLNRTERTWLKYRAKAEIVADNSLRLRNNKINPAVEEAVQYLLTHHQEMYVKNDDLLNRYLQYFDAEQAFRTTVLSIILLINIASLVAGFIYSSVFIIRPISKISKINEIVVEGDFKKRIDYDKKDELGKVAKSINALFRNLKNATDFIVAIGEGRLDVEYQRGENTDKEDHSQDRLSAALIEMRDKMSAVAEDDRQRNWVAEGLAKFAEILRQDVDDEEFSYRIISNLVGYMGINQGAIFIVNDQNPEDAFLELVAAYAYGKKKYAEKVIRKGEGLIGEVYQEGNIIYVTEVPEDYIEITSGLGGSNPRSILIVPLKLKDDIYGVVELASFQKFPTYKIEFVEKLSESLATTFSAAKANQSTQVLLQESMQLGEQMRAQEEEMRQNLEELVATQEELKRKNQLAEEQKLELQKALEEQQLKNEMLRSQEEKIRNDLDDLQETKSDLEEQNKVFEKDKFELQQKYEAVRQKTQEYIEEQANLKTILSNKDTEIQKLKKKLEEQGGN